MDHPSPEMSLSTPVIFMIFNRPDLTSLVFEEIAKAKPKTLLIVADGPRNSEEGQKCLEARRVTERVSWDCELFTNFADRNMGCKSRIASGLDWAFSIVEEAIVLEDDCLPAPSFFNFCGKLLDHYRLDNRVMHIGGVNFQIHRPKPSSTYYFSKYTHVWGWASWRRAWQHYDADMKLWPTVRDGGWLRDLLDDRASIRHWRKIFDLVSRGEINSWDYQWTFACWLQSGLSVMPNVNLVSNIGFHAGATHTFADSPFSGMLTEPMQFPLDHPVFMVRDRLADDFTQRNHVTRSLPTRLVQKLKRLFLSKKP